MAVAFSGSLWTPVADSGIASETVPLTWQFCYRHNEVLSGAYGKLPGLSYGSSEHDGSGGHGFYGFNVWEYNQNYIQWLYEGRDPGRAASSIGASDTRYFRIIMTWDPVTGETIVYNGNTVAASATSWAPATGSYAPNVVMNLAMPAGSDLLNFSLAEVALWEAALTPDEIALLVQGRNPLDIRRAKLMQYYPLRGDLRDHSGHGFGLLTQSLTSDIAFIHHPLVSRPLARAQRKWSHAALRNSGTPPPPTRQPMFWIGM